MLDYTIFGESHGPAVGVLVTGAAPGLPVDREIIARELQRRAPGGPLATARHEPDRLHILSGVYQGFTTGDPICLVLENRDTRSGDYEALRNKPRPGHADYAAWVRSGGTQRSPGRRALFRPADGPSGGGRRYGEGLAERTRY